MFGVRLTLSVIEVQTLKHNSTSLVRLLRSYKQAAQGSRAQTDEIDLVGHRDCLGESVNAAMRSLDDLKKLIDFFRIYLRVYFVILIAIE